MSSPMTVDEAVGILSRVARHELNCCGVEWCADCESTVAALAALEGLHIYASQFGLDDETWYIGKNQTGKWCVSASSCKMKLRPVVMVLSDQLLPTRAEAEAECAKRNQEGKS